MNSMADNSPESGLNHGCDAWLVNKPVRFVALSQEGSDFRRVDVEGKIVSVEKGLVTIATGFPLKVAQIVEWDDKHRKGQLHFAFVKSLNKIDDIYNVALRLF